MRTHLVTGRSDQCPAADAGFTLIELMIAVAIISVLATVAVPGYMKYMKRAQRVEGMEYVSKIITGAVTYYQANGTMPVAPAYDKTIGGSTYPTASGLRSGWASGPSYNEATSFSAICDGDLTALANKIKLYFRSPLYAKKYYVWDKLLFEPDGNKVRYHLYYHGHSFPNFLYGYATAARPRDCGNLAKGTMYMRTDLRGTGGIIRRIGPRVWETG